VKIAIVGAGIAGLYCAWRLAPQHRVTIFEANEYAGGHTHTLDVAWGDQSFAVDTGFIVFNERTYPHFCAMLAELGVASQPSNMSFSLRCEKTGLEYNGTTLNSLFAQRRNLLRPSFLRMIADILRFNRESQALLAGDNDTLTVGAYLAQQGYSRAFSERYILPMARAIWSAPQAQVLDFPARFFVDFFERHGFLAVNDRPQWLAVRGGSREYVRRLLLATSRAQLRLNCSVRALHRSSGRALLTTHDGASDSFDAVFLACHADQALAMLVAPSSAERAVLGAFPYARNDAILHTDETVLPRRPLARAAWNYHLLADQQDPVALTYDMNILQSLSAPVRFLVSLNHERAIDAKKIIGHISYSHPVYLPAGVAAQRRQREIDGVGQTYYCGAYWRYGFHEDGVVSARNALQHFAEDTAGAERALQRVG
jgi:predicted NAD/FAD-binding protein